MRRAAGRRPTIVLSVVHCRGGQHPRVASLGLRPIHLLAARCHLDRAQRVERSSHFRYCEDPSASLGMTYSFGSANGIRGGGGRRVAAPTGSIDGAQEKPPLKGSPQRRMAFVGRGEAKTQVEFSACGKWNIVACALTREVAELQRSRKGFRSLRKPLSQKSEIFDSSPNRGALGVWKSRGAFGV